MVLGGLQKLTLLDFPGKVACTVFTMGCNFRCGFCHNAPLVLTADTPPYDEEAFFRFLETRKGLLDGVAVTGGEPLLQKDIAQFLARIKSMGFLVKLDTNGAFPQVLRRLVEEKLVDYVAMDVKNTPQKYPQTCGCTVDVDAIKESVAFLKSGTLPFEFRTTAMAETHTEEDFREIGRWLEGTERYFIQQFKDSGNLVGEGFTAPTEEMMKKYLQAAQAFLPAAELRGV
jgi:pyruvate formate lyase activating enzyme